MDPDVEWAIAPQRQGRLPLLDIAGERHRMVTSHASPCLLVGLMVQ